MHKLLRIAEKKKLFGGKFITLWGTSYLDKRGKEQIWEWIEKASAVLVLPITKEREAILVKNYRVPVEKYVVETPAGMRDIPGELPEETARRELLEETGYAAERFVPIRSWPYRVGSSNGIVLAFIAIGAHRVAERNPDDTEDLTVVKVKLDDLADYWQRLPDDILFQPEILAMKVVAEKMGLI